MLAGGPGQSALDSFPAVSGAFREVLRSRRGAEAADNTRIIYGGSVTPENGKDILACEDVDGLFVGRAAWKPEGFAQIIELVCAAA